MSRLSKIVSYALLVAFGVVASAILTWVVGLIEPKDLGKLGDIAESNRVLSVLVALALVGLAKGLRQYWNVEQTGPGETAEFTPQLRANLLHLLEERYSKCLEDSLEHEVQVQLGMQGRPGVLQPDPSLRLVGEQKDRLLPRGTTVDQLFDSSGGRLLILGQPGAGKTTMMLELAKELVERAEKDEKEPVPVVINLASWTKSEGPLREWLVDALSDTAEVSSRLARTLTGGDDLLLLLDGLDEVKASKRSACVAAINEYLGERAPRVVVCSRTHEYEQSYEESAERLKLEKAAQIEPLTPETFIQALEEVPETDGLRTMLREDDSLRELATTPLMLSVMLLAYRGENPSSIRANRHEERRQALWDDYVVRMIARRQPTEYKPKDILRWLSWLAERMRQEDMTGFIPERMQPSWLTQPSSYTWAVWLAVILASGLIGGLVGGLLPGGSSGLLAAMSVAGVLLYGVSLNKRSIQLQEKVEWSFRRHNLEVVSKMLE